MKKIILGDCVEKLAEMEENSVDAVVCDPPAGIGFMGKDWDKDKGGRDNWIKWMEGVARECLRVLKPGGHALVWALPRTSHWTAMAWENAGFDPRDRIAHIFGTGFPKSMDIGKAIDKAVGVKREVVGSKIGQPGYSMAADKGRTSMNAADDGSLSNPVGECQITAPATEEAKQWEGWGTALKPAVEDWWLFRKPLKEKTVAKNVLKHGTGAINVEGCRIEVSEGDSNHRSLNAKTHLSSDREVYGCYGKDWETDQESQLSEKGRWPANLILTHHPECECVGTKKVKGTGPGTGGGMKTGKFSGTMGRGEYTGTSFEGFADADGKETIEVRDCHPDCPVKILDEQSGVLKSGKAAKGGHKRTAKNMEKGSDIYGNGRGISGTATTDDAGTLFGDSGGASRFFYCAKAPKKERTCDKTVDNKHPTVKPLSLMRYLCRLITPPNGIVLDPFMGSGSTCVAAMQEGLGFIGIEKEEEYYNIAEQRIQYFYEEMKKPKEEKEKKNAKKKKD